jgi:signal transduction histidine kinase
VPSARRGLCGAGRMLACTLIAASFLIFTPSLVTQTRLLDSLKVILPAHQDSSRYRILITLCWEMRAVNPQESIRYGEEALRLATQYGITIDVSRTHRFVGVAYRNVGDYPHAIEHMFKALEQDEQSGDKTEIGHSLNTIGRIFIAQQKPQDAATYLERAFQIAQKSNDERLLAYCLLNMMQVRHLQGNYSESLGFGLRALKLWEKIGAKSNIAATYLDLGLQFKELANYQTALEYYDKALALFEELQQGADISTTKNRIGIIYLSLGQVLMAQINAQQAFKLAQTLSLRLQMKESLWILAETASKQGNYKQSLEYYRVFKTMSDSLFSEESAKQSALYNAQYEYGQREQQIAMLENKARQQTYIRNGLIAIAILLIAGMLLFANRLRLKQHSEAMLARRAEEFAEANTMLRKAQFEIAEQNRRLVEMDKEKTDFLALTAHDLQNPLSAIHGIAEALHNESHQTSMVAGQHVYQLSGVILETSKRMFEMIVKILNSNALETGRFNIEAIPFEINFIITSIIDRFEQMALLKNIRIETVLPREPLVVFADQHATIEILENLLSNALKYSPREKRIVVSLRSIQILPANSILTREDWEAAQSGTINSFTESCIRIAVKDEGPGLTEEDKTHLFTKFAKLSAQPTAGEQSTGLGLSIVKHLTEAMNGRIWCESEYGYGASFIVELPAAKPE